MFSYTPHNQFMLQVSANLQCIISHTNFPHCHASLILSESLLPSSSQMCFCLLLHLFWSVFTLCSFYLTTLIQINRERSIPLSKILHRFHISSSFQCLPILSLCLTFHLKSMTTPPLRLGRHSRQSTHSALYGNEFIRYFQQRNSCAIKLFLLFLFQLLFKEDNVSTRAEISSSLLRSFFLSQPLPSHTF